MRVAVQTVAELELAHLFTPKFTDPPETWRTDSFEVSCKLIDYIDEVYLYEIPRPYEVLVDREQMAARQIELRTKRMEEDMRRVQPMGWAPWATMIPSRIPGMGEGEARRRMQEDEARRMQKLWDAMKKVKSVKGPKWSV